MAEKERITRPTSGSNEVGEETEERRGKGMPAGTDTQTKIAALSTDQKKEKDNVKNSDRKNEKKDLQFPEANETDE